MCSAESYCCGMHLYVPRVHSDKAGMQACCQGACTQVTQACCMQQHIHKLSHQGYDVVANTRVRSSVPTITSSVALRPASAAAVDPGSGVGLKSVPLLPGSTRPSVAARQAAAGAGATLGLGSEPWLPASIMSSVRTCVLRALRSTTGCAGAAARCDGCAGAKTGGELALSSTAAQGRAVGALSWRATAACNRWSG